MDFSVSPEIAALRDDVRAFIRTRLWPLEPDIEASGELQPRRRGRSSTSRGSVASTA